jgi:hypothetical protein
VKKPETTAGKGGTKGKVAFKLSGVVNTDVISIQLRGTEILTADPDQTYDAAGALVLAGSNSINVDRIKDNVHLSNATALGVTLNAYIGGNDTFTVSFIEQTAAAGGAGFSNGERYNTAAALSGAVSAAKDATYLYGGIGTDDIMTFTVGSNTVTAALSENISGTDVSTAGYASNIVHAVYNAFHAKYGVTGTSSATALVSLALIATSDSNGDDSNSFTITGLDPGSSTNGLAVSFSIANSTTGPTSVTHSTSALDYVLGATQSRSDNDTVSDDLIITLESNTAGTILNKVATAGNPATAADGTYAISYSGTAALTTLVASGFLTNGTDPYTGHYIKNQESRSDVRPAEGETFGSGDAEDFSRVHWLGS